MSTSKTRFLVISDTHDFSFEDGRYAYVPFQHPIPKVDVLLHCGDLTMRGGPDAYRGVLQMLGSIDAELKLVIAGNHDVDLDGPYWEKITGRDGIDPHVEELFADHWKSVALMKGPAAEEAGVTYLDEGMHSFKLESGAKFTLYASPYQPEFCGFAFAYERDEDRFNPPEIVPAGVRPIGQNLVPNFPAVDILMTHGPPKGILDAVQGGRMEAHVGCDALMTAVSRARPKLYCFGHIHEAYGATNIRWTDDNSVLGAEAIKSQEQCVNQYPEPLKSSTNFGSETLMANAAVMTARYRPENAPWLVELELPRE